MKKNILFRTGAVCKLALLLFATLIMTACDNGEDPDIIPDDPIVTPEPWYPLANTSWMMYAFVDMQTDSVIVAEPQCETCYTLNFDTDSTASGLSLFNRIVAFLWMRPIVRCTSWVDDEMNGTIGLYYEAIRTTNSYKVDEHELLFYYDDSTKYLLFKPYTP